MAEQSYECQGCGTTVTRRLTRGQRPKWCLDCRKVAARVQVDKVCPQCGASGIRYDSIYCSKVCAGQARRTPKPPPPTPKVKAWPRAPRSVIFITDCCVCDRVFVSRYTVSTCSPSCSAIKASDDKRRQKLIRRARQRDAYVADVSPLAIYKRDDWTCQLCGDPIDRTAKAPAPMAPTIDHVVALANGGTHEPSNVQAAHFQCNCVKGSRTAETPLPGDPLAA